MSVSLISPTDLHTLVARLEAAEDAIKRVRDARANYPEIPECDRYTADDAIVCGWKRALESIDQALGENND